MPHIVKSFFEQRISLTAGRLGRRKMFAF